MISHSCSAACSYRGIVILDFGLGSGRASGGRDTHVGTPPGTGLPSARDGSPSDEQSRS